MASILRGTFGRVREMIQAKPLPANAKATEYVDQKFVAELREAYRSEFPTIAGTERNNSRKFSGA